jgi:beta-fructofuranosidase
MSGVPSQLQPALADRDLLADDPYRPRYHFLPPSNWMNDPNGLIQWRGQYHLFYQYNPHAPAWGSIHWGHAISDDLVHWRDLPMALAPTPGTVDQDGVFSGCAFDDDGVPTVLYTGVRMQADGSRTELPCLATSTDDDLVTWDKYRGNPVIASPPPGLDVLGFRDHGVWREDGIWYQVIGSGIRGVGGTVFLYRSPDLVHWEYVHPLCVGDRNETGDIWECPDLFRLGEAHVLMVSPIPLRKTLYFVGEYTDHRFIPERQGVVDDGGYFYAPQSFTDDHGRRIMFGWLWEGRDQSAQRAAGWAGVMSLPRVLLPRSDGVLGVQPAPELRSLRGRHTGLEHSTVSPTSAAPVEVQGAALEIMAEFLPSQAASFGLKVRCSPDGSEQTLIAYDPDSEWLWIDREHSSLDTAVQREPHGTRVKLADGENLALQIFVDHSVVEVYANAKACLTSRIYPSRADSVGVELFARGGPAYLQKLDVWEMGSSWAGNA